MSLVSPTLQPTLHVYLLPLGQILVGGLSQLAVGLAVKPLGLFPSLTGRGGVLPAAGYAKAGNRLTVGGVAYLRITAQVADDDYLVHGCLLNGRWHIHQRVDSRINLFALKKSVNWRMGGKGLSDSICISKPLWTLKLNELKDRRHPITRLATLQKLD